jgi:hypothetical protein
LHRGLRGFRRARFEPVLRFAALGSQFQQLTQRYRK